MMAPALKNQISHCLINLTKSVSCILPKKLLLPTPDIPGSGTRNPSVTESLKDDPYVFRGWVSVWSLEVLVREMEVVGETFGEYKGAFMVVQGGLDRVVNSEGAFELFERAETK